MDHHTGAPTQAQIVRLYTLAGQAGLDHAEVIRQLREAYGVESTKQLSLRQYEEFCLWAKGRIGARKTGDGAAPVREGQLWQRSQIAKLLDLEWPARSPGWSLTAELRQNLTDVLDDFRLYRNSGRIGVGVLRTIIDQISRYDAAVIGQACEVWLGRYRERNEAYFLGILRRLKREMKTVGKIDQRQRAMSEHRELAEMERYGWKQIGRLPNGCRVLQHPTTKYITAYRGDGKWARLTPDEQTQIIRGGDN